MSLKRWALISGNTIVNIVDQENKPVLFTENEKYWIEDTEKVSGIGCFYENGEFINLNDPKYLLANNGVS